MDRQGRLGDGRLEREEGKGSEEVREEYRRGVER